MRESHVCPKCDQEQEAARFQLHKGQPNGWCRGCRSRLEAERRRAKGIVARPKSRIEGRRKLCVHCQQMKDFSEFALSKRGIGGLSAYCRSCHKEKFYDKEIYRKRTQEYRLNNRERHLALHRVRMFERRSKIKVTDDGTVTDALLAEIYGTSTCSYCQKETPRPLRTVDHKNPLSRGGAHSALNLTMACHDCNSSKRDMTVEEYLETLQQ